MRYQNAHPACLPSAISFNHKLGIPIDKNIDVDNNFSGAREWLSIPLWNSHLHLAPRSPVVPMWNLCGRCDIVSYPLWIAATAADWSSGETLEPCYQLSIRMMINKLLIGSFGYHSTIDKTTLLSIN